MSHALIAVQILLLIAALPLLASSLRTSRSRRGRHSSFMALATVLALFAVIGMLLGVALSADDIHFDHAMVFTPPVFTLAMCGWVLWRAISAANRRRDERRQPDPARPA